MAEELRLEDTWRGQNGEKQQHTFYLNRHESWSRTDTIWTTSDLRVGIDELNIQTNLWADHNPLKITWKGKGKQKERWTLNTMVLKEQGFIDNAKKKCSVTQNSLPQVIWTQQRWYSMD